MGSANTWVVLKNSSRPTLRDQGEAKTKTGSAETKTKTKTTKKSVSSGLETKTAVSRTEDYKTAIYTQIHT